MASLKDRISGRVEDIRRRRPLIDHAVRTFEHYGEVKGNLQAGAVTYFAFLSFFPILALAFFTIGYLSRVYPDAQQNLVDAIESLLPGLVGNEDGQLSLADIQENAATVGVIGLLGVTYSGLGWLSAMRDALLVLFEKPQQEQPSFVVGKLRDLVSLALIGVVLIVSVAVAGLVTGFSESILEFVGLGEELSPLLAALTVVIGLAANMLLFFAIFRLLADPDLPTRSLWSGALLGAVGFEVLKQVSTFLMASTKDQPAFQAFGIALILVVWINYFSRVVMYAAAWAHTSARARQARADADAAEVRRPADPAEVRRRGGAPGARRRPAAEERLEPAAEERLEPAAAFALGGAAMLGAVALARRTVKRHP